jgi:hypothetical protein
MKSEEAPPLPAVNISRAHITCYFHGKAKTLAIDCSLFPSTTTMANW